MIAPSGGVNIRSADDAARLRGDRGSATATPKGSQAAIALRAQGPSGAISRPFICDRAFGASSADDAARLRGGAAKPTASPKGFARSRATAPTAPPFTSKKSHVLKFNIVIL